MKTAIEKAVWNYMLNDLSIPRKELNGHAVCPWIKKYRDRIHVQEVTSGVKIPIEHAVEMMVPLNFMAIVLAFPNKPPIGTINKTVNEILNRPGNEDVEILVSNHRLTGKYRGIYTGFKQCDLVIIQSSERLKRARIASKKAGYYETD